MMTEDTMPTWLIVGGGSSLRQTFAPTVEILRRNCLPHESVAVNSAITWFLGHPDRSLRPDWYVIYDNRAIELFGYYARTAQHMGTKLIGLQGRARIVGADRYLPMQNRWSNREPSRWIPRSWINPRTTGLSALTFVANRIYSSGTPARVIMLGMDGYRSQPEAIVEENSDGRPGKDQGYEFGTKMCIEPFMNSVFEQLPACRFYAIGGRFAWSSELSNIEFLKSPLELVLGRRLEVAS